jgi:hypothetical protein
MEGMTPKRSLSDRLANPRPIGDPIDEVRDLAFGASHVADSLERAGLDAAAARARQESVALVDAVDRMERDRRRRQQQERRAACEEARKTLEPWLQDLEAGRIELGRTDTDG